MTRASWSLPEVVAKLAPWLESLPAGVEEFLSNDLTLVLAGTRFAGARIVTAPRALAAAIARIAADRLARGEAGDAAESGRELCPPHGCGAGVKGVTSALRLPGSDAEICRIARA